MQKTKTKTRENVGHGIPDRPDQGWFHKIERLSLSRHAYERRSTIVAPPSKANRPTKTTTSTPTPTLQQPVVRDTATNGINHSVRHILSSWRLAEPATVHLFRADRIPQTLKLLENPRWPQNQYQLPRHLKRIYRYTVIHQKLPVNGRVPLPQMVSRLSLK